MTPYRQAGTSRHERSIRGVILSEAKDLLFTRAKKKRVLRCAQDDTCKKERRQRGQASVEFALVLIAGLIPLTLGLVAFAELAWTYHSLATLTRQGARYAATHCWVDDAGSNVVDWMQANAPPFIDRARLTDGGAQIQVAYWTQDFANHETTQFSCAESCSPGCAPEAVTVSISGYQFAHLLTTLGLSPLTVPGFSTTVEMESAGANQDGGTPEP